VAKTVILSEDTIVALIEAHASMAAWYYQMSDALRQAGAGVHPPSDEQRKAFVDAMGQHFPELSHVAKAITAPRPFVPPPALPTVVSVVENEGIVSKAPPADHLATPDMIPSAEAPSRAMAPPPPAEEPSVVPPPPAMVDPAKVKYD
jgi:hypothetical protein